MFAGEYAAHARARTTTGRPHSLRLPSDRLERNADVVLQATYAPLFAHVEGWHGVPTSSGSTTQLVRSANWYVQMLYGTNKGTNVLPLTENGKAVTGADGLYATACLDKPAKSYIVKVANTADKPQQLVLTFNGVKSLKAGKAITMQSSDAQAENTLQNKNVIVPVTTDVTAEGNVLRVTIPAKAFVVYRF